ncbi:MAG: sensor histidine kinase [Ancrocorticia sp.]|uniref:sensor histidine kinase n=1 Tax=Ancrocorticia sp. TaxID=2593684 RepID=UPI003F910292
MGEGVSGVGEWRGASRSESSREPHVPSESSESGASTQPWIMDAMLGLIVTLALALIIATGEGGGRTPDPIAYLFAAVFGALMLARRWAPRTVLTLSVLGMFGYYILDYPPIGVAIPVVAAVFSAAEAGLRLWPVGAALLTLTVSLYFRVREGGEALGFLLGYESVTNIALFSAAIALGYVVRARRTQETQQAEIARLTEAQLVREMELQIQIERERISRELHDTVGHTLSVISLQAGVAAEAVGPEDGAANEAIGVIRTVSAKSLGDLRAMVRILRSKDNDDDGTRRPQSLSSIQELVETAQLAGVDVAVMITADPSQLADPVDTAAYRIIQESITNIVRHAGATKASVEASIQHERLQLAITDNGRGGDRDMNAPASGQRMGFGIAGMTERVRLLGGSLSTRSVPGEGYVVAASIPVRLS